MPAVLHQGILSLFEDDPWLGLDLFGIERPVAGPPIDRANTLNRDGKRPWQINPVYPDLVLVFRDQTDPKKGVVLCLEAQRENEPDKFWTIILYIGLLAAKHKLPVVVVIVSLSRAFSRLARSWTRGLLKIEALVLDVETVAPMTPKQARARPTAAVLAAALHGAKGNVEAARTALAAIRHLPEEQRHRYTSLILAALPIRKRAALLEEIPMQQRDKLWEIEKRSGTYHVGRKAGRKEGLEKGRVEGCRRLILTVLDVRGVPVTPRVRARIEAETDLAILERWVAAAREVSRASELLNSNRPLRVRPTTRPAQRAVRT